MQKFDLVVNGTKIGEFSIIDGMSIGFVIKEDDIVEEQKEPPKTYNSIKQYFRDNNNQKVGIGEAIYNKEKDIVEVYCCFCNTKYDKFDKDYPMGLYTENTEIPYAQINNFMYFLKRVDKYFRDKRKPNYFKKYHISKE